MPGSNAHGIIPERSLSVSRQISERNDRNPLGLPSVNGELANRAVATGCSASDTRSFFTMSASDEKSRLACTVQANLDFSSEADMVKKLRVSLALQPVATALFANS